MGTPSSAIGLFRRVAVLCVVLLCGATLPSLGVVVARAAVLPSASTTTTFSFTGGAQSYTVPAGVSTIAIDARGAGAPGSFPTQGGSGGETMANLSVLPGEILEVTVGGSDGFNGGGPVTTGLGIGGGGASDVRSGSCAATLSCGLDTRVVVAGGGGGAGSGAGNCSCFSAGGNGGGPVGLPGMNGGGAIFVGGDGGGGTQSVGGAGGSSAGPTGITGTPGSSGTGGNGGASGSSECGGGGGGGGYFGGGGGGGTDCGVLTTSGQGGGGGGGSGFGPGGATFNTGVQTGDGSVTIVATQPALTLSLLNKMQVQPCSNLGCAAATVRAKLQQTDGTPIAGAS